MATPYAIKTFTPTYKVFRDFNKFVRNAGESFGQNMPGVIKVILPKQWKGPKGKHTNERN